MSFSPLVCRAFFNGGHQLTSTNERPGAALTHTHHTRHDSILIGYLPPLKQTHLIAEKTERRKTFKEPTTEETELESQRPKGQETRKRVTEN